MALSRTTAVVTGAAMGIGRAVAEILLRSGANVALLDVNESVGKSLQQTLEQQFGKDKTMFLSCNVESEEQIKAALQKTVQKFGSIDIMCNNAGILNEGEWRREVSINVVGLITATFLALEHMSKLKGGAGGHIVNIASMAGLGPYPTAPVYSATKHAVVGFTRSMSLASMISGYGVRFNAVCPCFVQTELYEKIPERLGQFSDLNQVSEALAAQVGVIQVSDVAEAVLQLVMDQTKDGQALVVRSDSKKYVNFPGMDDL